MSDLTGITTLIVIPTLNRPLQAARAVQSVLDTSPCYVQVMADGSDPSEALRACTPGERLSWFWSPLPTNLVQACNRAIQLRPDFEAYGILGDDAMLLPGWFERAQQNWNGSFLGLDQLYKVSRRYFFASHFLLGIRFIRWYGGLLFCPHYQHYFIDQELALITQRDGTYHAIENCITHTQGNDATTKHELSFEAQDRKVFNERRAAGFPIDWNTKKSAMDHERARQSQHWPAGCTVGM